MVVKLLNKYSVLICTGFHRSATSATANLLFNAGLPMGNQLMAGGLVMRRGTLKISMLLSCMISSLQILEQIGASMMSVRCHQDAAF